MKKTITLFFIVLSSFFYSCELEKEKIQKETGYPTMGGPNGTPRPNRLNNQVTVRLLLIENPAIKRGFFVSNYKATNLIDILKRHKDRIVLWNQ